MTSSPPRTQYLLPPVHLVASTRSSDCQTPSSPLPPASSSPNPIRTLHPPLSRSRSHSAAAATSPQHAKPFFYKHIRWTADGTSLVGCTSANTLITHVVPSDLLSSPTPSHLSTHGTIALPSATNVFEPAPYFSLDESSTQLVLVGTKDAPIQLFHLFPNGAELPPVAGYKLIRHETEAFIQPSSALWLNPGTHFLVGSMNRLDYIDASCPGTASPLLTIHTIPSRRHISKGGGVGMKGMVSALDMNPSGGAETASLLAAGTWTRWVGLYDIARSAQAVGTWSVKDVAERDLRTEVGGTGIMQVKWSPCGRYLIINERQTTGMLVYDIRGTGQPLSVLSKENKDHSSQRVTCDVYQNSHGGFEVWAGDQNGTVAVWEDAAYVSGVHEPTWSWRAHDCSVGSTAMHTSGSVLATCGGAWEIGSSENDTTAGASNQVPTRAVGATGVKIWSIGSSGTSDSNSDRDDE
ncbi:WD40 repeat-like-containing domain [Ceratocystis lukuohia]|uniref:WD40 repeat-like-containing domain n=1 Tax=Ceratocystis lukuohia TaxID=2019550 RepID=A0ABR4MKJ8_9PEZI